MAFQMDEVWVNDGQFMVTKPNNEPAWMEVKGDDKVLHSSYLEGPVQMGKADVFSEALASCNIGREDKVETDLSLKVEGNVDINGDSGTPDALKVKGNFNLEGDTTDVGTTTKTGDTKQTGNINATEFHGAHKTGSISSFVTGRSMAAKPFDLPHPSKKGYRLRYVCVEGPENGVYFRGKVRNKNVIYLPEYWEDLVDHTTITVQLQPIGAHQNVIVKRVEPTKIHLQAQGGMPINCYYHVFGERQDIERLVVEYEGTSPADYPGDNSKYQLAGYNYDVKS